MMHAMRSHNKHSRQVADFVLNEIADCAISSERNSRQQTPLMTGINADFSTGDLVGTAPSLDCNPSDAILEPGSFSRSKQTLAWYGPE